MPSDGGAETVVMTYQELAARLDIDVPSARRRVFRSRWARNRGNDGKTRIAVPTSVLLADRRDSPSDGPGDSPSDSDADSLIAALQEALDRERARADRSDERERQAAMEIASLREGKARAEGEAAALRESLAHERERADRAEAAREDFVGLPWWRRIMFRPR